MEKRPGLKEAFWFWLKLGCISFGGPSGQIAIMHSELVERRRWVDEERFMHALNFCMLLPGPEAQQLATYSGWLLHGWRGGLIAGILFVLPSALLLWVLSLIYVSLGELPWISALFYGLKPAVAAIVIGALVRLGSKTLKTQRHWLLAALAFLSLAVLKLPFPAVILMAMLFGFFSTPRGAESVVCRASVPVFVTVRRVVLGLILWWTPLVFFGLWQGWKSTLFQQGLLFSKAALVTFGGAYAVLPYVAQQAVEHYQWLSAPQMLDGLGLAETTPGPLIIVLEFAGFLGGWQQPGTLAPLTAATLGAFIAVWATFVPCFLWIFAFAPYVEALRGISRLSGALSAVTAAVVGVILNLALWFTWHALVPKGDPDWFGIGLACAALYGLLRWKLSVVAVVLLSSLASWLLWLL